MTADTLKKQSAVQLVGEDKLSLNNEKEVFQPGPRQILCRVEAVGLCFSDLKLLKQFSHHVRKSEVLSGIEPDVINSFPGYAPGDKPTVPGHEPVVRVEAVGEGVTAFKPGERYLVQTDYRWLKTASSNAAFGYNIEGALQQYVLLDERIITSPEGESMLIPASDNLSASAIALVEPWACVEQAYAIEERQTLQKGGRLLVAAEAEIPEGAIEELVEKYGRPGGITWLAHTPPPDMGIPLKSADGAPLEDTAYDDVIYFGANAESVEKLFAKVAPKGLLNIVLCGGRFGRPVDTAVGRVHYGPIRIIGTTGSSPAMSMQTIPATAEIRKHDRINVIGAGGPMGVMHVIRDLCHGVPGISVSAGDLDDERLEILDRLAQPLAEKNGLGYRSYNSKTNPPDETFDYAIVMAPVPALVAKCVEQSSPGGIINIFAGIPATVTGDIDLDTYIEKELYFVGTSGSTLQDMKTVLAKVEAGSLDTNLSVAAVSGLDGAVDGIRAVENRTVAGKIIVYPACEGLGLTPLEQLPEPIALNLANGVWTQDAEEELVKGHL